MSYLSYAIIGGYEIKLSIHSPGRPDTQFLLICYHQGRLQEGYEKLRDRTWQERPKQTHR